MGNLTRNFDREDFGCHCHACAVQKDFPISKPEAIDALQNVRDVYGQPIHVARGLSCAAHNEEIGGAGDSRHLPEHADGLDLRVTSSAESYDLVHAIMVAGQFTFIEIARRHVHVDMRPGPQRLIFGEDH